MPEPVENPTVTPPTGTDPKPPVQAESDFDTSKLTDEQFAKLYEDPRLYKHTRFKQLTDKAQLADQLAAEKAEREKEQLKKNGEFEKLANMAQKERDEARAEAQKLRVDTAIQTQAVKLGAVDPEAVLALINRDGIKLDEQGKPTGIAEALQTLQTEKAYLFGKGANVTLGNPSNPANPNTGRTFKLSEMRDARFYREHEKEILLAQKEGRIVNDLPK